jgi:hypothetical protein
MITPLVDVVGKNAAVCKLPPADQLNRFKIRALLKFCDTHHVVLGKHTDLLKMYDSLKKEILATPGEYEIVKDCLRELREIHKFDVTALSDADASALDDIFELSEVDDVIYDSKMSHYVQTSLCGDDFVVK